jgi:hypothetical protein
VFEARLGLQINRVSGKQIQFIFTQINPANPGEEYMIEMSMSNQTREWFVTDMNP